MFLLCVYVLGLCLMCSYTYFCVFSQSIRFGWHLLYTACWTIAIVGESRSALCRRRLLVLPNSHDVCECVCVYGGWPCTWSIVRRRLCTCWAHSIHNQAFTSITHQRQPFTLWADSWHGIEFGSADFSCFCVFNAPVFYSVVRVYNNNCPTPTLHRLYRTNQNQTSQLFRTTSNLGTPISAAHYDCLIYSIGSRSEKPIDNFSSNCEWKIQSVLDIRSLCAPHSKEMIEQCAPWFFWLYRNRLEWHLVDGFLIKWAQGRVYNRCIHFPDDYLG